MPALQSQTHGYTDYPFLDETTKTELAARLHPVAEVTSGLEKSDLAAVASPSAVAAALDVPLETWCMHPRHTACPDFQGPTPQQHNSGFQH